MRVGFSTGHAAVELARSGCTKTSILYVNPLRRSPCPLLFALRFAIPPCLPAVQKRDVEGKRIQSPASKLAS